MPKDLALNWFDFIVLALLIFGLFRGRKNGMSEELLPILQVLLMVVLGARFYEPLGRMLFAKTSLFSLLFCFVSVYLAIAIVIKIIFGSIKTKVSEKITGADMFGRMEFYLGMLSGMIRYAGIIIMFLAVMNAKEISKAEMDRIAKLQKENFGDISFPTFGSIQDAVMNKSFTGKMARENIEDLLIKPTSPKATNIRDSDTIGRQREKQLDEVIKPRK